MGIRAVGRKPVQDRVTAGNAAAGNTREDDSGGSALTDGGKMV